jgi:hypothetical protein
MGQGLHKSIDRWLISGKYGWVIPIKLNQTPFNQAGNQEARPDFFRSVVDKLFYGMMIRLNRWGSRHGSLNKAIVDLDTRACRYTSVNYEVAVVATSNASNADDSDHDIRRNGRYI